MRKSARWLLAPILLTLTAVPVSAAPSQHLRVTPRSGHPGDLFRVRADGYKPHSLQDVFMECGKPKRPKYGSRIWPVRTDAHGVLSVQLHVFTPTSARTRPYTSCRVYVLDNQGMFKESVPFRVLRPVH